MSAPARRRDYVRNLTRKVQTGCAWCGGPLEDGRRASTASYCSDACVQADHEGIDDVPPAVVCRDPRSMSEEEKSRTIERMNDSYREWAEGGTP
jgi:hypothetical protein